MTYQRFGLINIPIGIKTAPAHKRRALPGIIPPAHPDEEFNYTLSGGERWRVVSVFAQDAGAP